MRICVLIPMSRESCNIVDVTIHRVRLNKHSVDDKVLRGAIRPQKNYYCFFYEFCSVCEEKRLVAEFAIVRHSTRNVSTNHRARLAF